MVHRIAPAVPRNCPCAAILQSTVPRENFDESGSRSVGYWRKKCAERRVERFNDSDAVSNFPIGDIVVDKVRHERRWTSAGANSRPQTGSLHPVAEAAASSFDVPKWGVLSFHNALTN